MFFLLAARSQERGMGPYGMPFNVWWPRYVIALVVGIILWVVILLALAS